MKFVHDSVYTLGARKPVIGFECVQIFFAGERALGFGLDESVLSEIRNFSVLIAIVELNEFLQRMNGSVRTRCQVSVEVDLQFIEQHSKFSVIEFVMRV